jgi:hypothetical protein
VQHEHAVGTDLLCDSRLEPNNAYRTDYFDPISVRDTQRVSYPSVYPKTVLRRKLVEPWIVCGIRLCEVGPASGDDPELSRWRLGRRVVDRQRVVVRFLQPLGEELDLAGLGDKAIIPETGSSLIQ